MSEKTEQMTPELKAFIEEWKGKPGNLIMVLHKVQQTYGYIPREIAIEISSLLDVPLAKIYGVVTFYNFFKLQKAGKYIAQVCLGTACYLRGGDDLMKKNGGKLSLEMATWIMLQTLSGLDYVHNMDMDVEIRAGRFRGMRETTVKGIVHRDLKPGNIFLADQSDHFDQHILEHEPADHTGQNDQGDQDQI